MIRQRMRGGRKKPPLPAHQTSYTEWTERALKYILAANTAGICPFHTHLHLVRSGYVNLKLYTVQQCLRVHGRKIDDVNFHHSNYHWRPLYETSNIPGGIIYGYCFGWNDLASTFSLSAHRAGFSVYQIWFQLIENGYAVTITEVVASLNAQGIKFVRRAST